MLIDLTYVPIEDRIKSKVTNMMAMFAGATYLAYRTDVKLEANQVKRGLLGEKP